MAQTPERSRPASVPPAARALRIMDVALVVGTSVSIIGSAVAMAAPGPPAALVLAGTGVAGMATIGRMTRMAHRIEQDARRAASRPHVIVARPGDANDPGIGLPGDDPVPAASARHTTQQAQRNQSNAWKHRNSL